MPNFQNSEQYLKLMEEDKKKHIQIISKFAQFKNYYFENFDQVDRFIRRYTRSAKELDCYTIERITNVMNYLSKKADYKWTLETVLKFIDEPIEKLEGQNPILILSNGEKIYDTKRLRQLESEGSIKWNGNKWIEKKC